MLGRIFLPSCPPPILPNPKLDHCWYSYLCKTPGYWKWCHPCQDQGWLTGTGVSLVSYSIKKGWSRPSLQVMIIMKFQLSGYLSWFSLPCSSPTVPQRTSPINPIRFWHVRHASVTRRELLLADWLETFSLHIWGTKCLMADSSFGRLVSEFLSLNFLMRQSCWEIHLCVDCWGIKYTK